MPLPQILTTTAEIETLAAAFGRCDSLAVDLEADSMHHYQEKVCLLQVTAGEETVLIDPLAGADLASLRPVMANPGVRKIFHAADYDIRCLARDFAIEISGLFDTMISCQFLGEERFGLADILGKYFGLELDKQYQRADWTLRPLRREMILYAAGDTAYLHQLVEILEKKLADLGRSAWVAEEFCLLERVRFSENEGPRCLRLKGASQLNPRQLAILEELLQWRDAEARRRDLPHYKVLGNKSLLMLSSQPPSAVHGLVAIEGISPRLADRYGKALLQAVERGRSIAEDQLPCFSSRLRYDKDPAFEKRLTQLKDWRKRQAKKYALDPGVLINNASLEQIARPHPQNFDQLEKLGVLKKWQLKELGASLLQAL